MPNFRNHMTRVVLSVGLVGLGAAGVASSGAGRNGAPDPLVTDLEVRYWEDIEPLLATHCFGCHGAESAKGGVRFDTVWSLEDALAMGDELALARELIQTHQMPPEGEPAPSAGEIEVMARWMRDALDYVPADGAVDPGWFVIHRLNRSEYRNTLRDLLGIDPSEHDVARGLPQDDTGYGFDNIAAVLSVSPLQIEGYLDAAERALDIALGPVVMESGEHRAVPGLAVTGGGRPLTRGAGGFMLFSNGAVGAPVEIPVTGEYEIGVTAWGQRGGDELPRLSVRVDRREARAVFVEGLEADPETVTLRVRLERGQRTVAAHFTNDFYEPNVADRNLAIESVTLAGPLPGTVEYPENRDTVLFARPADGSVGAGRDAAAVVLERFASRAFRRGVKPEELDGLLGLYEGARGAGDSHEEGVRLGLAAVLVSPGFLYRSLDNPHADDPGTVYTLSGTELASRLSYFLWSSGPDDELLAVAGSLTDEGTLRAQARRMLADPKADAFIENFAGQWLHLRNLDRLSIDQERFPEYDAELRRAMVTEATMYFGDVVRRDQSVMTLIDSGHTFVNGPLAALYGFAELAGMGGEFRRVDLPEGSVRGGVLTMGAVLTVTSNPTRTSPVKRGLYVLEQILGTPPPPPPPEIPPLEQAAVPANANASLREQLAAHLTDTNCAVCHVRMDPIGLAMENFDAIGAWRDSDGSGPIDASGVLPGGVSFVGPAELKQILLGRDDQFVENLTRKLLTYALGRGLEPFDRPTVSRIVGHARANDDRISAVIEGIVLSDAFRKSRGIGRPVRGASR